MKSIAPHNALPHRYPLCNIVNTIFAFFDKVCDDKHHVTEAIQSLLKCFYKRCLCLVKAQSLVSKCKCTYYCSFFLCEISETCTLLIMCTEWSVNQLDAAKWAGQSETGDVNWTEWGHLER